MLDTRGVKLGIHGIIIGTNQTWAYACHNLGKSTLKLMFSYVNLKRHASVMRYTRMTCINREMFWNFFNKKTQTRLDYETADGLDCHHRSLKLIPTICLCLVSFLAIVAIILGWQEIWYWKLINGYLNRISSFSRMEFKANFQLF